MIKKIILLLILSFSLNYLTYAAPPPPPGGSPSCWPPPCIPIDGGIGLLIAAGVAFGAKKMIDSNKKSL